MQKVLQAIYHDGALVLDEKLSSDLEGKTLKVIVITEDNLEERKRRFFEHAAKHSFEIPENYKFNREELYEQ